MAPKPNGFMMFVFEWKGKYGKHMNMREATDQCGKIWEKMDANARAPYNDQAKRQKESGVSLKGGKKQEKLTCTGKPLKEVEREKAEAEQKERNMKRFTDLCVRNCRKDVKLLGEQKFYFLMVNYFTKTLGDGHYVPAEIAVAEFTLHDGVTRTYHSLINPDCDIFGLQYEAKHHADNTHGLPLPPNALGTTNLGKVYNDVLEFIYDPKSGEYPPVYTVYSVIPVVESVLGFLQSDAVAKNVDLRVYSIQYLMYILKEETCELGEIPKISESMIAVHFSNDFFEYQPGIGCQYHEDLDKSKYCAKSCVIRWGFMFADLMCNDIAIKLIPGRHCPAATNFNAVMEASGRKNTDADTQSQYSMQNDTISMVSMNTYVTEPLGGGDFNIDQDEWHEIGSTASKKNKQRRTANSSAGNRQAPRTNSFNEDHREVGVNSWASRGKQDAYISSVGMDMMRDRDMDDTASIISSNYGRGSIISNASAWSQGRGRGRGRGFPPLS